jgi:hypothetical protein
LKRLVHDDYLAMRAGATVLEADGFGDKVLRLADGTMLKLFRRKRLFSSAAWYPYAQRFADNASLWTSATFRCRRSSLSGEFLQLRATPCTIIR